MDRQCLRQGAWDLEEETKITGYHCRHRDTQRSDDSKMLVMFLRAVGMNGERCHEARFASVGCIHLLCQAVA